jgi:hypothetical protein
MKLLRFALLILVSSIGVGCACKNSNCCKTTASVHHSGSIMLEGSY